MAYLSFREGKVQLPFINREKKELLFEAAGINFLP